MSIELYKVIFLILYLYCSKIVTNYYSVSLFLEPIITTRYIFVYIVAQIKFSRNTFHLVTCWWLGGVVWIIVGKSEKRIGRFRDGYIDTEVHESNTVNIYLRLI